MNNFYWINNINNHFRDGINRFRSEYNNVNSIIKRCEQASTPKEACILINLLNYKLVDMQASCLDVFRTSEQTFQLLRSRLSAGDIAEVAQSTNVAVSMATLRQELNINFDERKRNALNKLVRNFPTEEEEEDHEQQVRPMDASGKTKRRRIRRKKPYFNPNPNSNPTKRRRTKRR